MSRNFDCLRGADRQNLPLTNAGSDIGVPSNYAAILADELAQIENIVGHSIGKLKAVVEEGADAARTEKQSCERAIATLENEVTTLNQKRRDMEQLLQSRNVEVSVLSARVDLQREQIAQLEQSLHQVRINAASETQKATIAVEKIAELERQLRDKDALIGENDRQASTLKSEVSRLKVGILEMAASVEKQAQNLTQGEGSEPEASKPGLPSTADDPMRLRSQPDYSPVTGNFNSFLFDR